MMLADQPARDRLLNDLDASFVVEAAAGTGKTTVLVRRVVETVRAGRASLDQIVAVTFTEKAAGEMKLRLRAELERARTAALREDQHRLDRALEQLEVARIGTLHGLCADFLREYPVEAGVDPLFEVAAEDNADSLLSTAFGLWFERALRSPPEGVRRILRRRPRFSDSRGSRGVLLDAVRRLADHRDFDGAFERPFFERDPAIDALLSGLEEVAAAARQMEAPDNSYFAANLRSIDRFVRDVQHREAVRARDYDGLEPGLRELCLEWNWDSKPWKVAFQNLSTEEVRASRDALYQRLQQFVAQSEADLAACLQQELRPVLDAYAEEKARSGTLDFVDLLVLTRKLMRTQPDVRRQLQQRFTRLFVDEFQDTDPLQVELLLLLASSDPTEDEPLRALPTPGKLFVVGDPKQSIYRFRRADVVLYARAKQHLVSHGASVEHLTTSFRSTPAIQNAVNAAFSRAMRAEPGQAEYVALQKFREPNLTQPSLVALSVPRPYSDRGRITKDAIETSVPSAIGAFVEFLLRTSGWTAEENGRRVPLEARHICILFKRFRGYRGVDVPRAYAQQLEARRIPHVLVGGRSFHAREEVLALRTALRAVEWPDDELSVFATLKGPFLSVGDDALLLWRQELGRLHPLRPLEVASLAEPLRPVAQGLGLLRELHLKRNRRSVAETTRLFLEATRAVAGVAFWSAGDQAVANVLQLVDRAKQIEARATSFRQVVEQLDDEAEAGELREAPLVEEGTEGVRMMTVHAAKGLEFPVVILAEPTAAASRRRPSHWVDTERGVWAQAIADCEPWDLRLHESEARALDLQESLRLTYVAATRARDLLVVPAVGDSRPPDTWTEVLAPALYPAPGEAWSPRPAPGCPPFGRDNIVDRNVNMPPESPVPGLHTAQTGSNGVVWWDPSTLNLKVAEAPGVLAQNALKHEGAAEQSIADYQAWAAQRTNTIGAATRATQQVITAREVLVPSGRVRISEASTTANRAARPRGLRFGELVHAALARVSFTAQAKEVMDTVALVSRSFLATDEERAAATAAVEAALRHELFLRAARSQSVRREWPVVLRREDGLIAEGVVDLALLDGQGWLVVELKTDETLDAHREAYTAQLETYVEAVAQATGREARGVLLRV